MSTTKEPSKSDTLPSKSSIEERLDRKLRSRPTIDELVHLNVIKANDVAPALRAMRAEFEKAKMEDSLNRKLANRPTLERLMDLNLIKGGLAPALQESKHSVEKQFMEAKLNRKLANRPTKEMLMEQNLLKSGDPELLAAKESVQRKILESQLNAKLSGKYSSRWSAGKSQEAAPLLFTWDRKRDRIPSMNQQDEKPATQTAESDEPLTPAMKLLMSRKISSVSLATKSNFIQLLQAEGKFVCVNCCSEDFEGPELSSPRYSWADFYSEEEWQLFDLKKPRHNEEAKKKDLCNMCYGVCSCGEPIGASGSCQNCGSLAPISGQEQWRAPEHRRPRTHEEVEGRRAAQLEQFKSNEHKTAAEVLNNGEKKRKINFRKVRKVRYFQRYRFRNSFNDDCYFIAEIPETPSLFVETEDKNLPLAKEQDGLFFLDPDADGNVFAIALFEPSANGEELHPTVARDEEEPMDNDDDSDDDDNDADEQDADDSPATTNNNDDSQTHNKDDSEEYPEEEETPPATLSTAIEMNSTRVFLHDANKELFYYADKAQGEIYCWNPAAGLVHRV